ncbi:MAG: hypothetical protein FWH05_03160 [Oscillospiraceae bacterium]|nr:hypothetical protein [Oscillospiraceae bacterium]
MAYETKALLSLLADAALKADTAKEVYRVIAKAANSEGILLKPYEEAKKELLNGG